MSSSTCGVALAHAFVGTNAISNALCANSAYSTALHESLAADAPVAAFAAKNAVALVVRDATNPALLRIRETLQHRNATSDATRITSVALHATATQQSSGDDRVLAGDSEGNVLLWQRSSVQQPWQLTTISCNEELSTASVAAVTIAQTHVRWLYFASFSDGTLVAFEQQKASDAPVRVLARLALGVRQIMETLAVSVLALEGTNEPSVLLAAGGVDSKVHLFEVADGATALTPLLALEGHRGWIRSLAFEMQQTAGTSSDGRTQHSLVLASASQDQRTRLWHVTATATGESSAPDTVSATQATRDGFQAAGARYSYTVSFDALLIGHEDWVTSVQWTLVPQTSDDSAAPAYESALVSASMDNALVVWKKRTLQSGASAWFPSLRVGEMGGNGLLRGVVLPSASDRLDLLALSFAGQLERWTQEPAPSTLFLPALSLTGHCAGVTDLTWSPAGDYVLSVSLDQTARVLAPVTRLGSAWIEVSRAQVHGYDLNCAAFLLHGKDARSRTDRFVSGADEKILRVFEAPHAMQTLVQQLRGESASATTADSSTVGSDASDAAHVQHAYLPELSLTNKTSASDSEATSDRSDGYAVLSGAAADDASDTESAPVRVPVGETLGKKTLWPEQRKLYGHGNELLCVASSHDGSLLASACKAREERFASVWLWDTRDWSAAQTPLDGHKSSVVQLAFAPSDALLVSVSRDRHVCVYERSSDGAFALADRIKAHKRIIWSCAWSPDSRFFATASRDQSVQVWGQTAETASSWRAAGKPTMFDSAATAVAFAPVVLRAGVYVLAIGLESGAIQIVRVAVGANGALETTRLADVDAALSPSATVTRLAWSPRATTGDAGCVTYVLAAASRDYSVRLYNVELPQ